MLWGRRLLGSLRPSSKVNSNKQDMEECSELSESCPEFLPLGKLLKYFRSRNREESNVVFHVCSQSKTNVITLLLPEITSSESEEKK